MMKPAVKSLCGVKNPPDVGHWVQQESPSRPTRPSSSSCANCRSSDAAAAAVGPDLLLLETSAPAGGVKRNDSGATGAFDAKALNWSSDFWPKLSTISSAARSLPRKPTRTDWKAPSLAFGFASAHSRPSCAGRLARSKSLVERAAGQQRRGRRAECLADPARAHLVQVAVVDPDLLAVGDDRLLERLGVGEAEAVRARELEAAARRLLLRAVGRGPRSA